MKKFVFTSLLCFGLSLILAGQENAYNIDCSEKPLVQLLEDLGVDHQILFSYKTEDVNNILVTARISTNSKPALMQALLENTPLDFEIVEDTYIVLTQKVSEARRTLCVVVYDELSGEPLVAAHVYTAAKTIADFTDDAGRVELTHKFQDTDDLVISYVGYEPQEMAVSELLSSDCKEVRLSVDITGAPLLVISDYLVSGIALAVSKGNTIIRPAQLSQLPGQVDPDILGIVEFLPGISSPTSKASDLYIRGGTPDQNLILWEDIPIYHAAHYFGMITAIDPYIVDKVSVYRGGFGAEYGGRTAGVVDIQTMDETNRKSKIGVGSNLTHSYLYAHQHSGEKKPTAVSLSLRRSYDELWQTKTFKEITDVNRQEFLLGDKDVASIPDRNVNITNDFYFLDAHAKVSSQWSSKDRIEVSGLYAKNLFSDIIIDRAREEQQKDSMSLNNKGISIKLDHQWLANESVSLSSSIKGIATAYEYSYDYKLEAFGQMMPLVQGAKNNMIEDRQLQLETLYSNRQGRDIKLGYHLINYNIAYTIKENDENNQEINSSDDAQSELHSLYFSYAHQLLEKLDLSVGLRGSYYNLEDEFYAEPRLRLAYKLSRAFSLSANYGRHRQFVGQVEAYRGNDSGLLFPLWALGRSSRDKNQSVPIQDASLYQLGAIYNKAGWVVDVQLYNKEVDGISSRSSIEIEEITNSERIGQSYSKGIDFLVKKRFRKFNSWLSYSYSITELEFRVGKVDYKFLADHDQRQVFQWSNLLKLGAIDLGLGYKYSSGLPYSQARLEPREGEPGTMNEEFRLRYDDINDRTLPAMHEINLSGQYAYTPKQAKWKAFLNVSITNLLDTENIYDRSFVLPPPNSMLGMRPELRTIDKYNLGFMPNVNLRVEW